MLLVVAIVAPSIITLANSTENKGVVIDFNDEENKEDKKEVTEKDFFIDASFRIKAQLQPKNVSFSHFYVESEYPSSLSIFLPPPKASINII